MNLLEKFTTLRLEPTKSMVDYLTRAEYVSKKLELACEKVSENMLSSKGVGGNRSKERDWKSELVLRSTYQIFEWDRNNSDRNFLT